MPISFPPAGGTSYSETVSESLGPLSDSVSRTVARTVSVSETIGPLTDTLSKSLQLTRTDTETWSWADQLNEWFPAEGLPIDAVRAYYVRVFTNQMVFKRTLGQLLNRPALKASLNSGYHPITLELAGAEFQRYVGPGDIVQVVEEATGHMLYQGIVSDDPRLLQSGQVSYSLEVEPMQTELGDNEYNRLFSAPTEISDMVRDIVAHTPHLYTTPASCPYVGKAVAFNFDTSFSCLSAIEDCCKMAGPYYYYFVDHTGCVWFMQANVGGQPFYNLYLGADYNVQKVTAPISALKNVVRVIGAAPPGQTQPTTATYDASAGSPYGRRALLPSPTYSNTYDKNALQSIANTIGTQMNRRARSVEMTLPRWPFRIELGQPGGPTCRYWEPTSIVGVPTWEGAGRFSDTLVIVDVEYDGTTQKITASDMPAVIDDLNYYTNTNQSSTISALASTQNRLDAGAIDGSMPSTDNAFPGGSGSCGGWSTLARQITDMSGVTYSPPLSYQLNSGGGLAVWMQFICNVFSPGPGECFVSASGLPPGVVANSGRIPSDGNYHTVVIDALSFGNTPDGYYNPYITFSPGGVSGSVVAHALIACASCATDNTALPGSGDPAVSTMPDGTSLGDNQWSGTGYLPYTGPQIARSQDDYWTVFNGSGVFFHADDPVQVTATAKLDSMLVEKSGDGVVHGVDVNVSLGVFGINSDGTWRLPSTRLSTTTYTLSTISDIDRATLTAQFLIPSQGDYGIAVFVNGGVASGETPPPPDNGYVQLPAGSLIGPGSPLDPNVLTVRPSQLDAGWPIKGTGSISVVKG